MKKSILALLTVFLCLTLVVGLGIFSDNTKNAGNTVVLSTPAGTANFATLTTRTSSPAEMVVARMEINDNSSMLVQPVVAGLRGETISCTSLLLTENEGVQPADIYRAVIHPLLC